MAGRTLTCGSGICWGCSWLPGQVLGLLAMVAGQPVALLLGYKQTRTGLPALRDPGCASGYAAHLDLMLGAGLPCGFQSLILFHVALAR